jgi:hypothetical protein
MRCKLKVGDKVNLRYLNYFFGRINQQALTNDKTIILSSMIGVVKSLNFKRLCSFIRTKTGKSYKAPLVNVDYNGTILSMYSPAFEKYEYEN